MEDEEGELDSNLSDEDNELDDEEMSGVEDFDDEEEDENEGAESVKKALEKPIPQKSKAVGDVSKLSQPIPQKSKAVGDVNKLSQPIPQKTKAVGDVNKLSQPKVAKIAESTNMLEIYSEEQRRRSDRDKKCLFLRKVVSHVKKPGGTQNIKEVEAQLKNLHPDVVSVQISGGNAWLLFPNEVSSDKAYEILKGKKFNGKEIVVDFCGVKAKNPEGIHKGLQDLKAARPINPLEICITNLPRGVTDDNLQAVYPTAKKIHIPVIKTDKSKVAFVTFQDEVETRKAFDKGRSLKIDRVPVNVYYARIQQQVKKAR